jgi:PTS system nitrogen regulatory IIA component
MEIKDFLAPSQVMIDVRAADKVGLLQALARRAAIALDLAADVVASALLNREELGSTGTGGGVAIPHARLAGVDKPFGMLVRLAKAIDFDAIDGQPIDIVFLLLLPEKAQGEQLNALACAARVLRDPEAVRNIRRAADVAAVFRAVTKDAARSKP